MLADRGGEYDGFTIGGHDCAVCLARNLPRFKNELTPAPLDLLAMIIEHWFSPRFPPPDCRGPFLLDDVET